MAVSDQVRFLEEKVKAYEEMHRKEIKHELGFYGGTGLSLQPLTRYDWANSLEDHFYSMKFHGSREVGLILPFRRLIFHNLTETGFMEKEFNALSKFSDNNGYAIEYYQFAWQHEPVIEGLQEGKLPALQSNRDKISSWYLIPQPLKHQP